MNYAPPDRMSPADIVAEIGSIQRSMTAAVDRLHVLSNGLYRKIRKAPVDDNTAIYLRYASSWMQFAGAANQGMKRSAHVSKSLRKLVDPTEEETKENTPPPPAPKTSTEYLMEAFEHGTNPSSALYHKDVDDEADDDQESDDDPDLNEYDADLDGDD